MGFPFSNPFLATDATENDAVALEPMSKGLALFHSNLPPAHIRRVKGELGGHSTGSVPSIFNIDSGVRGRKKARWWPYWTGWESCGSSYGLRVPSRVGRVMYKSERCSRPIVSERTSLSGEFIHLSSALSRLGVSCVEYGR